MAAVPKKTAVDILTTLDPEDDEQRYKWQFILDTKKEKVEQEFSRKHNNISLSVDYATQQYIVTFDSTSTNVKDISKILHMLSYGLKTVHKVCRRSCYDNMKSVPDLRIYQKGNSDNAWLVGEEDAVKVACDEIDQHNSGAHSGDTEQDLEESWENVGLTEIPLTRQEQAVIHLYKLWDMECLKKNHIHMQKDEKPKFEIKIFVENKTEIKSIENELRSMLQPTATYPIYSLKQSFDANVIRFISTDPVSRYVDNKMNYYGSSFVCPWYIDPSDNVVIVYAKTSYDSQKCLEKLKRAVKCNSFNVPAKWFGTSEIEQLLSNLKAKHGHEVDAWLSSSFSTLHFISTQEKALQFEQDLKSLFVTRTLTVSKEKQHFCKQLLQSLQNELEEKFHVNLNEDENNFSYGWVIKGGTEYVQEVYKEMKALVDDVCSKSQCYQLDFGCPDHIEMDLKEMATPSCQIAVDGVSLRSHKTIDLRDDVLSHRWVLPNGNDIKIVNADYHWLYKDSTLLQITEATGKHLGKHFSFRPDDMTILLYLPKWMGNDGKEKEILKSSLDELYQGKGLEKRSTCISTAYFVEEPRKLGWPTGMFLKQILLSLGRHKVVTPFIILEPCRKIFEQMSDTIQKYADLIRNENGIKITVKRGELAKEECDAIVNSTSGDLRLDQGAVSTTILAAAGDSIQNECDEIMIRRGRKLSSTEVEMTNGYKLRCKYVFHGALVSPWNEQTFRKFVESCLRQAEKKGISSIAFPSIGTGNLCYPVKDVARTMFQTVQKFAAERNDGCLKEVAFVIYHKDHKSLQAFQEEEKIQHEAYMKKESREKCPKPAIVQITVTGGNVKIVDQTFRQIEDRIKEKHVKMRIDPPQEPVSQDITRSDEPDREDDLSEGAVGFQDMSYSESDNQEKWEPNMPPARETLSSRGDEDGEMTEGGCSIKIELIKRNTEGSRSDFVRILKKYEVNPESIIWCRYTPNEVKVKLARASDGTSLMDALKNETQYKVYKCNVEAVIDIRAKLNISMNMFLDIEGSCVDLENESGVKVERSKDGIFTIAGDLSEIRAARCILINWKNEEYEKRVASETHPTGATGNQTGEESSETVWRDLMPHSESNFMVTEQRQVSIKDDGGLRVQLNTVKTKNLSVKENKKVETVSGNVEQDSRNIHLTASRSKSVQHNSDSTNDSKTYDKSRIKSAQNKQTINPNLFDEVENKDDLHKNTYVPPYQASNADNKLQNCPSDSHVMTTKEGVKVFVYQGNLCDINVDCIVNSSNEKMDHRSGLAGVVSEKAGQEMDKECRAFIKDHGYFSPHNTCVTTAGKLRHYQCVVHVCSPVWADRKTIEKYKGDLSGVVTNALVAADSRKMGSIAIPAIGSGGRGGPTELCFPSYVHGVVAFSSKKPWLQEVHFVDIDVRVVDMMKAAFLLHTPEKDTKIKDKLKKIPRKVKEKFISFWRFDEPSGNIHYFEYAKNITVVICDGALFTGYKHKHIQDLVGIDTLFDNSAVVIIENKIFNGSSRSAALCLQRGGNDFHRYYDLLNVQKKTVGNVYHTFGDSPLKFGHVLYAILPAFDDKALNPKEESAVIKYINQCFSNLLKKADKWKISHLCMPFLAEDFSDQSLFETCVSNMMREIETFDSKRKAEHKLLIHIATNKDEKLHQILQANFSNPRSKKKPVHPDPKHSKSKGSLV